MSDTVFRDPLGAPSKATSLSSVLSLIETQGEAYWNNPSGNGTASLYYYANGKTPDADIDCRIDFTMKDQYGFHAEFLAYEESSAWYATTEQLQVDHVWINYAGGKKRVISTLFVSRQSMADIVDVFYRFGKRTESVPWISAVDIPWKDFEEYA